MMVSSCARLSDVATRAALPAALARLLPLLPLLIAGCDLSSDRPECRFGAVHTLASSGHRVFDGLAVTPTDGGAVALWSDTSGLYGRRVDRKGRGVGAVARIGGRCPGGLAARASGKSIAIACLRPGVSTAPGDTGEGGAVGAVALRTIDARLSVTGAIHFGSAGPLSRGVSLVHVDGGLRAVWLDAAAEHNRVWFAQVDAEGNAGPPRIVSDRSREAGIPDVVAHAGKPVVVFREAFMQDGKPAAQLVLWSPGAGRTMLARLSHEHPSPRLAVLDDDLYVVYRDRRRREERIGLYVARIRSARIVAPGPLRVARADGDATPALSPCFGGLVTSTPRTFAGDYFVGVSWLGPGPTAPTLEQQFYEDAHEFTDTAAACVGEEALLLIGERGRLAQKETTLRSATFSCR